jgi:DNA-directed RNA polymerase specialized sigma24 family protein
MSQNRRLVESLPVGCDPASGCPIARCMSPSSLSRYRAERLLRKGFPELRSKVLAVVRSQLRGKGIALDPADLEACYAQAWQGLYATVLGGERVENPSAWLVLVTFRRAIDESRAAPREPAGRELAVAVEPDYAATLDDGARLRHVFEALRNRLSARECEAASLCYLQGLSRAEAAARLGISEARMRKLMEGAGHGRPGVSSKVSELLDTIKGEGWCEQQSSLMRAYAFGILDPDGERHALAVAHCRECPACRAHVASLRGLASVLPPLPLLSRFVMAGGAGKTTPVAGGQAGAGVATGSGIAGSLTAKLAVTALVVLGAGYAVLGNRAHGSPATRNRVAVSRSVLSNSRNADARASSLRGATSLRRTRLAARRSSVPHRHALHYTRSTGDAAAREFGPERVGSRAASLTPTGAPRAVRSASAASNEFGFE